MKHIRWSGLITFTVIVASIFVLFILFIDNLIKAGIESTGSDMLSAKVELGNANLSFSPLGLTLNHIQITNPDSPMSNIVEINKIAFAMEAEHLIRHKLLINNMYIDGLRMNTVRKYSGALKKKKIATTAPSKKEGTNKSSVKLPTFEIPDVDQILKKEPLKVDLASKILKEDILKTEQSWETLNKQLPDAKRIKSYETRFNKIKKVDYKNIIKLKSAINELKSLQTDISKDSNTITKTHKQITIDSNRLSKELKTLINAPKQDYEHLTNKFSLSTEGATNIGVLFFGDKAKKWSDTAIYWYNKLQPVLSKLERTTEEEPEQLRSKGLNIHFKEFHPRPDFLIKKIHANIELEAGKFKGQVLNLTSQQSVIGKPTTFRFNADNMKEIKSLKLTGEFNRLQPTTKDHIQLTVRDYNMDNSTLLKDDTLTIAMADAKSSFSVNANRTADKINATIKNNIHSIQFNNINNGGGEIKTMLVNALNNINSFNINGRIYGTLTHIKTEIKSDLDKQLGSKLNIQFKKREKAFKNELKTKLDNITKSYTDEAQREVDAIRNKYEKEIQNKKRQIDKEIALVQQQVKNYEAQIKTRAKEVENKAKKDIENKLKDTLKGLFK